MLILFKKTVIFEKSERQRILFTLILPSRSPLGERYWSRNKNVRDEILIHQGKKHKNLLPELLFYFNGCAWSCNDETRLHQAKNPRQGQRWLAKDQRMPYFMKGISTDLQKNLPLLN